jgi:hypothetical protein
MTGEPDSRVAEERVREMTLTVFLSLLYQESNLYTADYSLSEEDWGVLVLAALAVILFSALFWRIRRRNRS